MKDIWILSAATVIMITILLAGQLIRGDFAKETLRYAPIAAELGDLAVEQDGRALININRAETEMLTRIDGIGPTLAARIIEYRDEYGPFSSLDELIKVEGIGMKKLEAMKKRMICLP